MGGITIRLAEERDRPEILRLLTERDPELDAVRRYAWLYENNPQGRGLVWLAVDEESGRAVGLTGYIRRDVFVDGRRLGGALGGNAFVVSSHRRRGISRRLNLCARGTMASAGIQVKFSVPQPGNLSALAAAGAATVTTAVSFVRPLVRRVLERLGPVGRASADLVERLPGPAEVLPARRDDPRIDEIWARVAPEVRIATVRDARFYTWRFLDAPSGVYQAHVIVHRGKPIAACAVERADTSLYVVDLLAPLESWGTALASIATLARGCTRVQIQLAADDGRRRALWRYGFFARGAGRPFVVVVPEGSTDEPTLYDPAAWFVTSAESDIG